MNYDEAIEFIHGTYKFGSKLGLDNMRILLELMGNPHDKLKYIHVAGTNGKGSTVSFISSVLMEAGYKVGIYTSPFIQRFTERIKVNEKEIDEDSLARITGFVKEKVALMLEAGHNHPTEFEIVTAMGFQYFSEMHCDIVVLEVGLGGRFDSTNIIKTPLVCVITTINYDHMNRLGNTLPEIAFQKAGIIKKDGDVVIYPQQADVEKVFDDVSNDVGAKIHKLSFAGLIERTADLDGQTFDFSKYMDLKITLLGSHQTKNAAVAIKALEIVGQKGYNINETAIRQGLLKTIWAGRFELLRRKPVFIIDGAHNAEGAIALVQSLVKYFPNKKIIFIFGVIKEKDYRTVVEALVPIAKMIFTVKPNDPRGLPSDELANYIIKYNVDVIASPTVEKAVEDSLNCAKDDDVICSCGSLYYIGEVRSILCN